MFLNQLLEAAIYASDAVAARAAAQTPMFNVARRCSARWEKPFFINSVTGIRYVQKRKRVDCLYQKHFICREISFMSHSNRQGSQNNIAEPGLVEEKR